MANSTSKFKATGILHMGFYCILTELGWDKLDLARNQVTIWGKLLWRELQVNLLGTALDNIAHVQKLSNPMNNEN